MTAPFRPFRPSTAALSRRVLATALAHVAKQPVEKIIKAKFPDLVTRAPSEPPLGIDDADAIGRIALADFLTALEPVSTAARVLSEGLALSFDRAAEISVPSFAPMTPGATGFVEAAAPIPVAQLLAGAALLRPTKIPVIVTLTREMLESSNAEKLVSDQLVIAVANALEAALFDNQPGSDIRPPGLRFYNAALPSGATAALDMRTLIEATQAVAGSRPFLFVARASRAIDMLTWMPQKPPQVEVLASAGVPDDVLICIAPLTLVSAVGSPSIEIAREATLHMDDAPGAVIASAPTRSLWQTDAIALKITLPIAWSLRQRQGVAWTQPTWETTYTGGGGGAAVSGLVPIGPAPPATQQPGQLWWRNDPDATLYIRYDDGGSVQWVPAAPGATAIERPPANIGLPVITGTPVVGSVLNVSNGDWSGAQPITFARRWQRDRVDIAGATNPAYTLTLADDGGLISAVITATNDVGVQIAEAREIGPITQPAPVNDTPPEITGAAEVGETLTVSDGDWSNPPDSYTYQWQRDDGEIAGEMGADYVCRDEDIGEEIFCAVTATNSGGSATATSNRVGPVTP